LTTTADQFGTSAARRRVEGDASWAATLDTLRAPRKQNQSLPTGDAKRQSDQSFSRTCGVLTEDTFTCISNKRVAQTLLARFRAQAHPPRPVARLSRAGCGLDSARDLLGRLSLYGQGAERLHEELVPLTHADEPSQRRGTRSVRAGRRGKDAGSP